MLSYKCKNEYHYIIEDKNRKAYNLKIAGSNPAPNQKVSQTLLNIYIYKHRLDW